MSSILSLAVRLLKLSNSATRRRYLSFCSFNSDCNLLMAFCISSSGLLKCVLPGISESVLMSEKPCVCSVSAWLSVVDLISSPIELCKLTAKVLKSNILPSIVFGQIDRRLLLIFFNEELPDAAGELFNHLELARFKDTAID